MYPKNYNPDAFVSVAGERYKPEYIGEPDEDGLIHLVKVGEVDLVELHQRDAFANDVNVLYQRFCNGDVTALSQAQGTFLDTLGMPRDLRGMYDMIEGYKRIFDNLDSEKKKGYTFGSWLEEAGSEKWLKDFVQQHEENRGAENGSEAAQPVQA